MKLNIRIFRIALFVILLFFQIKLFSQGAAGSDTEYELRYLVDLPTTGVLKSGDLGITFSALPFGVLMSKVELAIFKNFSFGISYCATNFIGTGKPSWHKYPGFNLRVRIFREVKTFPSITLGFDTQGKGKFIDSLDRYEIKSPGAFLGVSKNYKFLGYLSLYGVVNYSFEKDDGDENINFGFGIEKTIGSSLSIVTEYDMAINDNSRNSVGKGKGYLNMGLRWAASYGLTIGVDLRNILGNKKLREFKTADRAFYVGYVRNIF